MPQCLPQGDGGPALRQISLEDAPGTSPHGIHIASPQAASTTKPLLGNGSTTIGNPTIIEISTTALHQQQPSDCEHVPRDSQEPPGATDSSPSQQALFIRRAELAPQGTQVPDPAQGAPQSPVIGAGAVGQAAAVGLPCVLSGVATRDSVSQYGTQAAAPQAPAAHAPLQVHCQPHAPSLVSEFRAISNASFNRCLASNLILKR